MCDISGQSCALSRIPSEPSLARFPPSSLRGSSAASRAARQARSVSYVDQSIILPLPMPTDSNMSNTPATPICSCFMRQQSSYAPSGRPQQCVPVAVDPALPTHQQMLLSRRMIDYWYARLSLCLKTDIHGIVSMCPSSL
jgi:hypothetical protein